MKKHPIFNLHIYTQKELENLLKKPILSYQMLREWSLSSVFEVSCEDTSQLIVKYMREPLNIEGEFYSKVEAPFIPTCLHIINNPPEQIIIYEKMDGTHPNQLDMPVDEILQFLETMLVSIKTLTTKGLPARIEIDTPVKFSTHFSKTLAELKGLIYSGKYHQCNQGTISIVEEIITNPDVIRVLTTDTGYAHGDLAADNVLCLPDGSFSILDWQRCIRGSFLLDQYIFLESMGISPLQFLPVEAFYLAHLERIDWYVATSLRWNPSAIPRIDGFIFTMANELAKVYYPHTK